MVNKKALKNYEACFSLLKMYREELKKLRPDDFDIHTVIKRRKKIIEIKEILHVAKILRISAL